MIRHNNIGSEEKIFVVSAECEIVQNYVAITLTTKDIDPAFYSECEKMERALVSNLISIGSLVSHLKCFDEIKEQLEIFDVKGAA